MGLYDQGADEAPCSSRHVPWQAWDSVVNMVVFPMASGGAGNSVGARTPQPCPWQSRNGRRTKQGHARATTLTRLLAAESQARAAIGWTASGARTALGSARDCPDLPFCIHLPTDTHGHPRTLTPIIGPDTCVTHVDPACHCPHHGHHTQPQSCAIKHAESPRDPSDGCTRDTAIGAKW